MVAIVCCVPRRKEFHIGYAIQAIQGGWLDVDDTRINSAETPASRSRNASEYGNAGGVAPAPVG